MVAIPSETGPTAENVRFVFTELHQDLNRPQITLNHQTALWFFGLQVLKDFEAAALYDREPTAEVRDEHRACLTLLLATGETLAFRWESQSAADPQVAAEVRACRDYLRDRYAMWYAEVSPERQRQILKECFGVEN